jgi:hypothetical protein
MENHGQDRISGSFRKKLTGGRFAPVGFTLLAEKPNGREGIEQDGQGTQIRSGPACNFPCRKTGSAQQCKEVQLRTAKEDPALHKIPGQPKNFFLADGTHGFCLLSDIPRSDKILLPAMTNKNAFNRRISAVRSSCLQSKTVEYAIMN